MDLTFQVPLQYWSYSIRFYFHHKSHPQLGIVFALALSLCSFWSFFFTDLQYHNGHLLTWGLHLSVSYLLSFHTVHGVLKAKILKWFATPFSSRPLFSELSILTHLSWVALHGVAHSFIELDKAVVHVIILISFL